MKDSRSSSEFFKKFHSTNFPKLNLVVFVQALSFTRTWKKWIWSLQKWCLQYIESESFFLNRIFSDNRVILVTGKFNRHNVGILYSENLYKIRDGSCNSEKLAVLHTVSIDCVTGLYYFEDPIVTGGSYLHFLQIYFHTILSDLPLNTIVQNNKASPQYSRAARALFDEEMPDSEFGRGSSVIGQLSLWSYSSWLFSLKILPMKPFSSLHAMVRPS